MKSTGTTLEERPEVIVVDWIDSSLQNGQVGRSDYPSPELIRSVGWLVAETPQHLTLARDDHKDDEFRGLVCIPIECIRACQRFNGDGSGSSIRPASGSSGAGGGDAGA